MSIKDFIASLRHQSGGMLGLAASEPTLLDVWDQRWFYGIKKVQVGCLDSHNLQWLTEAVVSELEVLRGIIHGVEGNREAHVATEPVAILRALQEHRKVCKEVCYKLKQLEGLRQDAATLKARVRSADAWHSDHNQVMVEQVETLRGQLDTARAEKTLAVEVLCATVQQQQRDVTEAGTQIQALSEAGESSGTEKEATAEAQPVNGMHEREEHIIPLVISTDKTKQCSQAKPEAAQAAAAELKLGTLYLLLCIAQELVCCDLYPTVLL
ncbi:hypothetical protein ABBQ38_014729 [Trebouxia sp. C0009 RCD-2024]